MYPLVAVPKTNGISDSSLCRRFCQKALYMIYITNVPSGGSAKNYCGGLQHFAAYAIEKVL